MATVTAMNELSGRLARLSPEQRQRVLEQWRARRQVEPPLVRRLAFEGGDFPLSFAQERLWFLDQMTPGNPFYNITVAHRIPFAVDRTALDNALTMLVQRHSVLRTIYPVVDGSPVQRVLPSAPVRCEVIELQAPGRAAADGELQRLAAEAAQRPFDLAGGPVFRVTLVRTGPLESAFLFVVHHIAADSSSMDIIFRELGSLYADAIARRAPTLQDIPVQYADFAVWQREWLRSDVLASQVAYWQRQLAGLGTLDLPTDRPRPPVQMFRGAHVDVRVPEATRLALLAIARDASATPFMLLLTALFVLLHRYSEQDDFAVGVPVANRTRRELEGVVGFFANSLVMRADMGRNPTFRTALARVREMALQAYSHQDLPFSAVVAALRPHQDLSRNPMYQVSFQLVSRAETGKTAHGSSPVSFERGSAIFDLVLNLWEVAGGIEGVLEYNTDLFDRDTADRMVRHYLALLDAVAADPEATVGELPLLSDQERRRMLVEWNETAVPIPERTAHALVDEQVRRTPGAVALQHGDSTLSYAELDERASAVATELDAVNRDDRSPVGVMLPASIDLVVAILGVLKSGRAYVPLDPATPLARLTAMLDAASVHRVITRRTLASRVPPDRQPLAIDLPTASGRSARGAPVGSHGSPSDAAYIIFTSGSSGAAKGVTVPHRAVVNYLTWCRRTYPIECGIGVPLCSAPWSDMSITALFVPLISGKRVVLLDDEDIVESLDAALRAEAQFSFVKLTPSHLDALQNLSLGRDAPARTAAFVVGGEALLAESVSLWRERAPGIMIYNEYGPTEATVGCVVHAARPDALGPGPVPIGRPIANTRLYLLDAFGEPVPVGVAGELYIGGAGVALGYASAPTLTRDRFMRDPFRDDGSVMYRTGDRARYRINGTLEFVGRMDDQIKIRGHRVEPGDVEVAMRRHPGVSDAVVSARDVGRRDRRLFAHVVLAPGTTAGADILQELRDFLRRELPPFMIPNSIMVVDAFPLTPAGKIDIPALHASLRGPVAPPIPVLPDTPLERVIALVFQEVLGTPAVSATDDFFTELGGHSLLATKAIARLRELLRVDLPLRWMFEAPTVRALAALILLEPARGAHVERVCGMVLAVLEMRDDEVAHHLASRGEPVGDAFPPASGAGPDEESPCA
jgi:amino acid adenylation domain-containing protein